MDQKTFSEILRRYLANACTPQEEKLIDQWFESLKSNEPDIMTSDMEKQLLDSYQEGFQHHFRKNRRKKIWTYSPALLLKIAATILVILVPFLFLDLKQENLVSDSDKIEVNEPRKIINTRTSAFSAVLPDGSTAVLNPGAVLSFQSGFEGKIREVHLEGEAFFDVVHDASSPFVVKARQLTAWVLGTSFTVKANKNDNNIIVTVKTGKVSVHQESVAQGNPGSPTVLTPNQQAIYDIEEGSIVQRQLEDSKTVVTPGKWQRERFNEAPVVEVFRGVERVYQTKIVFDENNFNGCLLSTSISADEDLFERLDIICKVIGATYKVDNVSIVVSGKPCK